MTLALELSGAFLAGIGVTVTAGVTLGPWYVKRKFRQALGPALK